MGKDFPSYIAKATFFGVIVITNAMKSGFLALLVIWVLGFFSCQLEKIPASAGTDESEYRVAYWTGVWILASIRSVSLSGSEHSLIADSLIVCDSALSWSRDGTRILFTSDWQVYAINSDGTQLKKLSSDSSKDAFAVWSPEGLWVAYQSEQGGKPEIYVMLRDGTGKQRLTSSVGGARMPSWSPDGGRIAYTGDGGIRVVNVDGTADRQLTSYEDDFRPLWSPNGTKILFRSHRDGNYEVYVMNSDGSNQTNISNNPATDEDQGWSPDGEEIVFVSNRDAGPDEQEHVYRRRELYTVNVDGSRLTRITYDSYASSPAWSPDGLWIVYVDYALTATGTPYVTIIPSIGGTRTTRAMGFSPIWSPVKVE